VLHKRIITMVILVAALLQPILAQQVTKTGTTAAKFLSIGVGPRANAMGGAYTAIANDVSAMYWNPAGIANVNEVQTLFTYTRMFADINVNYFGIVFPAGEFGTFGASITALNVGEMDVTSEDYPEGTGEKFSAGSYAFALTISGKTFSILLQMVSDSILERFSKRHSTELSLLQAFPTMAQSCRWLAMIY